MACGESHELEVAAKTPKVPEEITEILVEVQKEIGEKARIREQEKIQEQKELQEYLSWKQSQYENSLKRAKNYSSRQGNDYRHQKKGRLKMFLKTLIYVCVLAVITTVFTYANMAKAEVVTKGLVSYWSFDKADMKGKTVKDVWGKNDGTLKRNARIIEGKVREALECPNKEDYVDVGKTPIIAPDATEFTIMAWIKTADSGVGGVFGQFSTPGATGSDTNHWLHSNGFDEYPPSGGGCKFSKDIKDDKWHHIAVVRAGAVTMYLDGKSDNTCPPETYSGQAPNEIQIGSRGSFKPESYAFKGLIDEVGVYARALSDAEVLQNFHAMGIPGAVVTTNKLTFTWGKIKATLR